MKRLRCTLMLCGLSFVLLVPSLSAAEVLTNDTIVMLVKAGLGEGLIISKIKMSQGQYDLSTNGILQLKKDGVGDKIIQAMMEASAKPAPSEPRTAQPAAPPPVAPPPSAAQLGVPTGIVLQGQSLFVKVGDRVLEVLPVVAEIAHSMKKHFIPFYFGPGDNWHYVRGQKSVVRVPKGKPLFYTKVNPSAFLLARLSYDSARNIRYVVSTGAAYRDTIPVVVNRLSDDLFELSPGGGLEAGEYAFVSGGTFYDFGVE